MNKDIDNFHLTDTEESDETVFTDEKGAKIEREYAKILSELLEYIYKVKCQNKDEPIIEIISDFCFKNNLEPEKVGDAIREDYFMYEFVMKDCVHNKIDSFSCKNVTSELEDW